MDKFKPGNQCKVITGMEPIMFVAGTRDFPIFTGANGVTVVVVAEQHAKYLGLTNRVIWPWDCKPDGIDLTIPDSRKQVQ